MWRQFPFERSQAATALNQAAQRHEIHSAILNPDFEAALHQQQIPALAKRPHYRTQFEARLDHLHFRLSNLQAEINAGRLDLQPQADEMQAEITRLQELLNG